MTTDSPQAALRLSALRDAIDRAARLTDRSGEDITLIAVSKTQEADAIRPLIAGLCCKL